MSKSLPELNGAEVGTQYRLPNIPVCSLASYRGREEMSVMRVYVCVCVV